MARPINQRLSLADCLKKIEQGKKYAAQMAIRYMIEKEVEPIIEANRKAESFLSGGNRTESQGYVMDLTKYREQFALPCKMQGEQINELAVENNAFAAIAKSVYIEPQSLAEQRG